MTKGKGKATLPAPPKREAEVFVLPHSLEAERVTLGAALINTSAADYLADHVDPAIYFRRAHRAICEAVQRLREQRVAVDLVTLGHQLQATGGLEGVGGPVYLAQLVDGLPPSINVQYHADILRDLSMKRLLVHHGNRTIDLVAQGTSTGREILADADTRLLDLASGHTASRMAPLGASSSALLKDLERRVENKGSLSGIDTGYPSVNALVSGWQAGDLIIVAARPSIGKTTFVLNSAVHGAQTCNAAGDPVRAAIFSLEMRRVQLEYRMLSSLSAVPLTRILGGYLGDADYASVANALSAMATYRIEVDDRTRQTVGDIRAACRRLKADGGLDLVVVDYVQLMEGTLDRRSANRNEELSDISRKLKILADELSVPVVVLSQLSRENEKRADPRPRLSDLRESGALEQDADIVAFLHRRDHRASGTTNFIVEKQRNGPTGTVNLTLQRDITLFLDGGEDEPEPEVKAAAAKIRPMKRFSR